MGRNKSCIAKHNDKVAQNDTTEKRDDVGIKRQIHEHSQYIQFTYYKLRYYSLVNVMQEIGLA